MWAQNIRASNQEYVPLLVMIKIVDLMREFIFENICCQLSI